jgi:hypothetical protein
MGSKSNIHSKFLSVKLPITRSVALSRNSRAVDGQFGIIPGPKSHCGKRGFIARDFPYRRFRIVSDLPTIHANDRQSWEDSRLSL